MYSYKIITGHEIEEYSSHIANFRIKNFHEFPYLYEGNLSEEIKNIKEYHKQADALLVLVFSGEDLVAISTGFPLKSSIDSIKKVKDVVVGSARKLGEYFYFAETIISKNFRGCGILSEILKRQEKLVKEWGYKKSCFVAVIRPKNHPLRPKSYHDIDSIFESKGYHKTSLIVTYTWPTLQIDDSVLDEKNDLMIWEKTIA